MDALDASDLGLLDVRTKPREVRRENGRRNFHLVHHVCGDYAA
jgi:hypothetical protein